jgi:4-hydroxy-2-oxoheptanedioate aldolase
MTVDWKLTGQRIDRLLERARSGEQPAGVNVALHTPAHVEIVARFPCDWLILDQEHTLLGSDKLVAMIRAAETLEVPFLIKLARWDPLGARDALDAGAHGLMIPFVESAAQLEGVLAEVHFPPLGRRGFCSVSRATSFAAGPYAGRGAVVDDYLSFNTEHTMVVPTLETARGLENLEALFAVPGCPVWHVGLEDLALSLGGDGRLELSRLTSAAERIQREARRRNKLLCLAVSVDRKNDPAQRLGLDNHLPYVFDTECLAYGFSVALAGGRRSRRVVGVEPIEDLVEGGGGQTRHAVSAPVVDP